MSIDKERVRADYTAAGVPEVIIDIVLLAAQRYEMELDSMVKSFSMGITEPGDMTAFRNYILGEPYAAQWSEPVYLVEAYTFPDSFFRSTGSPVQVDGCDRFDKLRLMVYAAFGEGISHIYITHKGERRLIDSCAQFMHEYAPQ